MIELSRIFALKRLNHAKLLTRPDIWGKRAPNGYWEFAEDMDNITKTPNIAKGMVARGYSDTEIQGVLGENWLRLFKKVWGK